MVTIVISVDENSSVGVLRVRRTMHTIAADSTEIHVTRIAAKVKGYFVIIVTTFEGPLDLTTTVEFDWDLDDSPLQIFAGASFTNFI